MLLTKVELRERFAREYENHYKIDFLVKKGYSRKICACCGKGFWSLDPSQKICPDPPCSSYTFLGDAPTKKKLDYVETWKAIERFFKKEGHESIRRYPVVCRWYPLFFNIASIVDFYRIEDGNLVFDFPANPLIVPQFCMRFNDIPNVGVTGRHYTCFCMIGQHALYPTKGGYWKDRTIELDFNLLKQVLKIPEEEIVFVEDVWLGPAAFGPSMEYYVRGLELGNAVFTQFSITPEGGSREMRQKVVDMGAGLERFAWITQGTPTSYDVTFEPAVKFLLKATGATYDQKFFLAYSKLAANLNFEDVSDIEDARGAVAKQLGVSVEELKAKVRPIEAIYAIADHTAALTFAIADGALPSNVGGGYNLRVIFRRALAFLEEFGWKIDLAKLAEIHAQHLKSFAPELKKSVDSVAKIFDVERKRFNATRDRARTIVADLVRKRSTPGEPELIKLYESEGVAPELIREAFEKTGKKIDVPADFYVKLTEKHMSHKEEEERLADVSGLPATELLFYKNQDLQQFKAKVLKIIEDKYVVLDKTAFYARAGGQEPDRGSINGCPVVDIRKQGGVVVHVVELPTFKEGQTIEGNIDWPRRLQITQHHDATHTLLAACRKVLGPHVWQHSAFKDFDKARLDITHYDALTDEQLEKIEKTANEIITKNVKITKSWLSRREAEKKFGFGLYQGGAAPGKVLRIVSIDGIDTEACAGTHFDETADMVFIKILKAKRIQDGAVRIEFTAGKAAASYLAERANILKECAKILGVNEKEVPKAVEDLFERWKSARKELKELISRGGKS